MSQTDRQTDKATHWKTAVFDTHDNWARLQAPPPAFIKFVKSKKEICPTTGQEHFQIHVCCNKQVRLTQMCSYIQYVKWFPVIGEQHIKNSLAYIEKEETTAPGAKVHTIQGEKYYQMHELLQEIAKRYQRPDPMTEQTEVTKGFKGQLAYSVSFETLTSRMVEEDVKWVNKLCNPQIKKMWEMYHRTFIMKQDVYLEETNGAYIIEGPDTVEKSEVCEIE